MARATEKHQQLLAQVISLHARRDELVQLIAQTHIDERAAREAAIENEPSKRSNWRGALSPIQRIEKNRASYETEAANITRELEAAGAVLEKLKHQMTVEQAETVAREKAVLDASETALLQKLTDQLEQWLTGWQELAAFYAYRQTATFLNGASSGDASIEHAIQDARGPLVEPQPVDALAAFEAIYEHCCDPRGVGVRDGQPVALGQATCQNWLAGTRDLRELETYAPVPANGRPRFASKSNTQAYGGEAGGSGASWGANGVQPIWRTGKPTGYTVT